MPRSDDDISIQLERHYFKRTDDDESGLIGWGSFVLPVVVGSDYVLSTGLSLVLNGSFISEHAVHDLRNLGIETLGSGVRGERVWLRELRAGRHNLPDLEVRIGVIPEQLGLDALLERNFLQHFPRLSYDIASHIITLTRTRS